MKNWFAERKKRKDKEWTDDVIKAYDKAYLKYEAIVDRPTFNRICTDALKISNRLLFGDLK